MLTKKRLIEKLKENQHLFTPDCISVAQDMSFENDKVKYKIFVYKCDKQKLCLEDLGDGSLRWWQEGKPALYPVFVDGFSIETEEYEGGFENCKFNLSELLGE